MNDTYLTGETNRQMLQQQLLADTSSPQHCMLKENDLHSIKRKDIYSNFNDISKSNFNRITTHDLTNFNNYTSESESTQNKTMDETCNESDGLNISHNINNIEKFFDQILESENESSFKETSGQEIKSNNCFFCINCCIKFETNREFLDHCSISDDLIQSTHGRFRLNKEQERFLTSNLVIYRNNDKELTSQHRVDTKISVFLLNTEIKHKFMENYSHDLLVANEETAICLDNLNNTDCNKHHYRVRMISTGNEEGYGGLNEDDRDVSNQYGEYDDMNDKKDETSANEHSLLFVDYSIVQIGRILEKIKHLYTLNGSGMHREYLSDEENEANDGDDEEDSIYEEINENNKFDNIDSDSDLMNSSYEDKEKSSTATINSDNNDNLAKLENNLSILNRSKLFADSFKQQQNQNSKALLTNVSKASTMQQLQHQQNQQLTPQNKVANIVHSRNACKKLKCPKCNWHYKYRETLDIHMREKHSTDLNKDLSQQCIYCLDNSQHPRLGRGEQYKCGYKPYRCDICDYSTTTKGNLSIHMQSDKHINNLKEVKTTSSSNNDESTEQSNDNELESLALHLNDASSKSTSNLSDNEQIVDTLKTSQVADDQIQLKCNICNDFETDNKKSLRYHKQMAHEVGINSSTSNSNSTGLMNSQLKAGNGSVSKISTKSVKAECNGIEDSKKKTTADIENLTTAIFCPLCQIKFNDQNLLQAHLEAAHNVINEDALKILVNSARTLKKIEDLSKSDPSVKQDNVFPSISLDQLPKLSEFTNSRFNSTNQNGKLMNQKQQDMSKLVAKLNTASNNDIQTNRSRSSSRGTTNASDDNDDIATPPKLAQAHHHHHQQQLQNQLDTFISSKSNKSNRAYRKLISQLCQQYTDNNNNAPIEISTESNPDAQIKCYACTSIACFSDLTELKSHLEDEHSVSLSPSDTNALIYKYIKDTLRDFSQNLSEDLIQRSMDNFDSKLKVNKHHHHHHQQQINFSADTLLNPKKANQDIAAMSQNQALLNYLATFAKTNGTSMTTAAPNAAFLNQFLLPLMFQQQQQQQQTTAKNSSEDLKDSPCQSPIHHPDEDDSDLNGMHYGNHSQNNSSDLNNSRRRRTRITEDQLKVLRQYFDINKSPSDEQITDIAQRTQLQAKVIKHWFRNTLFKERQKDKDSPYNFNNPPVTQLNIEEYEKTGKITNCANSGNSGASSGSGHSFEQNCLAAGNGLVSMKNELLYESVVKAAAAAVAQQHKSPLVDTPVSLQPKVGASASRATSSTLSTDSSSSASSVNDNEEDFFKNDSSAEAVQSSHTGKTGNSSSLAEASSRQQRPNRTKFSNVQIRALNQLFKEQRYPKDEQVAKLGKQLHLKQRVITVWFQNARQKARKSNTGSGNNSHCTASNKSPSSSSQDYENNDEEPDDFDETDKNNSTNNNFANDDEDEEEEGDEDNNYYDTDFDDNQSQASSVGSGKQVSSNNHESEAPSSSAAVQNASALQLAMSFLAAHQGQIPKDQSFAALAAAFNSSILNSNLTNGHDNNTSQLEVTKRGGDIDDEDEEDTTNGYDENDMSDDEQATYANNANANSMSNSAMISSSSASSNAKRLRTTILPEQQEYLMQKYQLDQNPSRKMLDEIAREVRLKKRVVQVWFQNTRARERKGIIKITNNPSAASSTTSPLAAPAPQGLKQQHPPQSGAFLKRCLFCVTANCQTNVFHNRSALESHLILKHNYTYEQTSLIDVDQFPDADAYQPADSNNSAKLLSTNKDMKRHRSPSLSPAPLNQQASQLQNFYSNLLMQQQAAAYQPFNGLQSPQGTPPNPASNGINSLLMSQLFNQLQQKNNSQKTEAGNSVAVPESPLDLTSVNGANTSNLSALSSIALAAAAAYNKGPGFTCDVARSRSNSSNNGENSYKSKQASTIQQQQRRVRTQMTQYQVNVMRLIFAEYKTPTMNECEQMGREINLKKRVVQVWFQNARAKEKKSHPLNTKSILFSNTANNDLSHYEFAPDECLLCGVKYNNTGSAVAVSPVGANSQAQRDHLFSKMHVNKLIQFVTNVAIENGADVNAGKFYTGFHSGAHGGNGSGSDYKRKFEDDEEENESGTEDENEGSNGDNDENIIEYGDSEEHGSDTEGDNFEYTNNTKNASKIHHQQKQQKLKTSNDSSFSSTSSNNNNNNNNNNVSNNNIGNNFNDENDENNTAAVMSPGSILKSLSQGNSNGTSFDVNRLMQMSASRAANLGSADISTSTTSTSSFQQAQQQQQNIYNYLLYSNLLNNGKL